MMACPHVLRVWVTLPGERGKPWTDTYLPRHVRCAVAVPHVEHQFGTAGRRWR